MANHRHTIEGSLLVLNEDYSGASIVVPAQEGRSRFETFRVTEDDVFLVDRDGNEHALAGLSLADATFAAGLGAIVLHEIDVDTQADTIPQYGLAIDCPETAPGPRP
jgi:hypothetical protein